jgi:hypothetical protein
VITGITGNWPEYYKADTDLSIPEFGLITKKLKTAGIEN